ncbi:anaerobic ribonucleoside-triphosphate reductase activating protein [Thermotoga neapolitana]|uniref:Anaerobic ribonucleoside-triphosphate reductase activating protein n=1 Tax=Thermotoga neapolitana (strain ATCC 49049 / DSM 4359 / NBRC 107923 / NS-E) TaxID=309803 RepID=B9KBU3_THENN|nr:anaerobic ribonucleoside-triphosphate reductase activating protein [Thermotoga neapolitana]ACM22489.1 Anaerobic ribonucleoside-triphosphate reductase activating protein [Thermotoga neapolitana DSM 4359]KFZ22136.1 Anaerobic ribonucleoside-triphosphate reductase activating protein [Thermotoga neapolitana LA10]HBF11313.1 anaerobic ribonucleoside-triphosphate reductase activating protein [Thermotoga neapolitana]
MYINRIGTLRDHPDLYGVSVYFQGCDAMPKCHMCHNPETWHLSERFKRDPEDVVKTIDEKLSDLLRYFPKVALVLLGGEPLAPYNREDTLLLSKTFKEKFKDRLVVVLFTWRLPKDIVRENLLEYVQYVDEFVMGRYLHTYRREGFPASRNQLHVNRETFEKMIRAVKRREHHGSSLFVRK